MPVWSALKTKEIKLPQVLFSLSVTICLLSLGSLSCPGDCAASSSWTFITATPAGGIIYSSMGCAVLHTLLIFIWDEVVQGGWGVVSEGRWGGACLSGSIWIFHCFQHFVLLVGRIEMAVNGGNIKCPSTRPPPPLPLPSLRPVPACSSQTAAYIHFSTVLMTVHNRLKNVMF